MGNTFASAKWAIAICDRCGQRYKLKQLRRQVIKQKLTDLLVCPSCLDPDQPQLMLGSVPINDPQALRNPRPDTTYTVSGKQHGGNRIFQWGWNPVGGSRDGGLTPNNLHLRVSVGSVTVAIK